MLNKQWLYSGINASVVAACTLITATSHAALHNVDVVFDKTSNQYVLSWQANASVTVSVAGQAIDSTSKILSSDLASNVQALHWQAPAQDRYAFTVTEKNGDMVTVRSRVLNLEGGRNVRELGGYQTKDGKTVKWGKLYRSGALHKLTANDYAVLDQLDIATVVDFRGNEERSKEVTTWQAGEMQHMTWDYELNFDTSGFRDMITAGRVSEQDMVKVMAAAYPGLLNQQKEHYKAMFSRLVQSDESLLFHCTAGKDRTGVAAALILHTLGVDEHTIMQDYVMSEAILDVKDFMSDHTEDDSTDKPDPTRAMLAALPKEAVKALMGTRESYLNAAYEEMRKQSGSIDAFIRNELGVSDQDIARLKANFLE